MSATYFITGATGFIGQCLTRKLVERGARVKCLVRPTSNRDDLRLLPNVEFVEGDLKDGAALASGVADVDGVFHLAGLTRENRSGEFMEVNCGGTTDLARYCARSGRRPTLVFVSSLSASGVAQRGDAISGQSGERLYELCRRKRRDESPHHAGAGGSLGDDHRDHCDHGRHLHPVLPLADHAAAQLFQAHHLRQEPRGARNDQGAAAHGDGV